MRRTAGDTGADTGADICGSGSTGLVWRRRRGRGVAASCGDDGRGGVRRGDGGVSADGGVRDDGGVGTDGGVRGDGGATAPACGTVGSGSFGGGGGTVGVRRGDGGNFGGDGSMASSYLAGS